MAELWPWDLGDVDEPDTDDGEWRTQAAVRTAAAKAPVLIALGGDGSITFPVVVAAHDVRNVGLVCVDAALDLRDGVGNLSSLRRLIDVGLNPARTVQLGAADWSVSRSHADEAHARGIGVISRGDVAARGAGACMAEALGIAAGSAFGDRAAVHVSLDLSVCDRAVAPAVLDSVPGGLGAAELLAIAFAAGRDPRVRSFDLVEIDATADVPDQRTVRLAAMAVLEFAAGLLLRPGV